jgi:RNA polymerase sigma factor (sigma-70 family)
VHRHAPTFAEQEQELVVATDRGDPAACRELVELFLPAIAGVARSIDFGGAVHRRELVQEGVAGLLFAAKRYDPATGTPFWGYASFWVRKAMQELVAEVARPVALSDHAARGLARLKAERRSHVQAHRVEPSRRELAAATGFGLAQIDSLLASDRAPRSFEDPVALGDAAATFGDTVADPRAEDEYARVLDRLETQVVRSLAEQLEARERAVLESHYGLGRPQRTLKEIGSDFGISAERVRQIEKEALEKLRLAAAEPPLPRTGPLESKLETLTTHRSQ